MKRLEGKSAVVTGAASGIGRAKPGMTKPIFDRARARGTHNKIG